MIVAGLTGSIGMGKSTTAQMFRDLGVPVFDSDQIVHELYGNEAVGPVGNAFPDAVSQGKIDREKLGRAVIGNAEAFRRLEQIVHPMVRSREKAFRNQAAAAGEKLVVLDIPLLFETGRLDSVDVVIVVSASQDEQRRRVLSRPGMTEEKFTAILSRQVPDSQKRKRADFVVDTGKGMEFAREQVAEITEHLRRHD